MDLQERKYYNSYVIKQHDPKAEKILYTSPIGEAYEFDFASESWEQLNCKGTVFLYSRSGDEEFPYALLILNRERNKDFFLGITMASQAAQRGVLPMEVDVQENTVMIQVSEDKVYGVWLFDEQDRAIVKNLIQFCITNDSTLQSF